MKSFVLLLAMAFSFSAFAKDPNAAQTQNLLKLLMENSATAKVINKAPEAKTKSLSDLLSEALNQSSQNDENGVVVTEMTSSCKNATPRGVVGASTESCDLMVMLNYYNAQADGSLVKDGDSSYIFSFKTVKPVVPHPVLKLEGPVTVQIAG